VKPRIHADDHAVARFEMLKSELERLSDQVLSVTHPPGRQNLETEAGLVNLLGHFGHLKRIGGKERIADLDRNYRRHFLQLLRCPGKVVEARHEKVHRPAFVGDPLDTVGIVGRDAGQHARIAHAFDEVANLVVLALPEEPVGDPAVVSDGDGLGAFDHFLDRSVLRPASVQADELHLRASLPQRPEDSGHQFRASPLVGIDALTFALPEEFDDLRRCEVLLHVPVQQGAQIRVPGDGIRAGDQTGDLVVAEPDGRQQRGGRRGFV